jgi:RNA polymerase sigma-70 factor (ECF subfamily)
MTPSDDQLRPLLQSGYRYALSLTHDPTEAEDLLHDACLAVVKASGQWHRGYLFPAIRTRFINRLSVGHRHEMVRLDDEQAAGLRSADPGPEASLADKETVAAMLGGLRPQEREAIYLTVVEGMTAQEVADLTDRPRGTILSLVRRARIKLQAALHPPATVQP